MVVDLNAIFYFGINESKRGVADCVDEAGTFDSAIEDPSVSSADVMHGSDSKPFSKEVKDTDCVGEDVVQGIIMQYKRVMQLRHSWDYFVGVGVGVGIGN